MKALKVLASLALAATAFGQMRDKQDKQMTCDNGGYGGRAKYCEIREASTAAMGLLNVDPGQNGGATVKGWSRNEVLVRTRVEGWAGSDANARVIASQVYADTSGGHVQARGPESTNDAGCRPVGFRNLRTEATNLTVKTINGGITVSDIRGSLAIRGDQRRCHLRRLAGDVTGSTVNGGVNLETDRNHMDGSQVQVTTRNGGVNISVPENYSAHFRQRDPQRIFALRISAQLTRRCSSGPITTSALAQADLSSM